MKQSVVKAIIPIILLVVFPMQGWGSFDSAMRSYEKKNYYVAQQEFKKLATENDADAQYMLGYMYTVGKGVLQDYIEAHKWFNLAASRGNKEAIKARSEVERQMTREQIALAQKKAREWSPERYQKPTLSSQDLQRQQEPRQTVVKEVRDKGTVRQVQQKLAQLGYSPGVADGSIGHNTRKAIRQYQSDKKLSVDGKLSQDLVAHLFPAGILQRSVKTASAKGLLYPDIWLYSSRSVESSASFNQLHENLAKLVAKGRQQRAAQPWFLNQLADLLDQHQTPWSVMLFSDNFKDGDFTTAPKWSVQSGNFSVTEKGLYSQMSQKAEQPVSQQAQGQDLSTAILGAIFDHATRDKQLPSEANTGISGIARITTQKSIPSSFALKARLSLHSRTGRVEFGPYTGKQQGYQLLISPEQNQVELLRNSDRSSAVIESRHKKITLNQIHTIEWIRDEQGVSTIALDGKELFKVTDRRYRNKFSGFVLSNFSSSVTLHDITIVARKN